MCPAAVDPDLIVIPELPDSAIVKVSALEDPSVVVPINTRPLESMRSLSPALVKNLNASRECLYCIIP